MKKIFLALAVIMALFAGSQTVSAANWVTFWKSDNGYIAIDTDTIANEPDGSRAAWLSFVFDDGTSSKSLMYFKKRINGN